MRTSISAPTRRCEKRKILPIVHQYHLLEVRMSRFGSRVTFCPLFFADIAENLQIYERLVMDWDCFADLTETAIQIVHG